MNPTDFTGNSPSTIPGGCATGVDVARMACAFACLVFAASSGADLLAPPELPKPSSVLASGSRSPDASQVEYLRLHQEFLEPLPFRGVRRDLHGDRFERIEHRHDRPLPPEAPAVPVHEPVGNVWLVTPERSG